MIKTIAFITILRVFQPVILMKIKFLDLEMRTGDAEKKEEDAKARDYEKINQVNSEVNNLLFDNLQ